MEISIANIIKKLLPGEGRHLLSHNVSGDVESDIHVVQDGATHARVGVVQSVVDLPLIQSPLHHDGGDVPSCTKCRLG